MHILEALPADAIAFNYGSQCQISHLKLPALEQKRKVLDSCAVAFNYGSNVKSAFE